VRVNLSVYFNFVGCAFCRRSMYVSKLVLKLIMCTCTPTSHAFSSFCVKTYYYHMLFLSFTTFFIISILNIVQYRKTIRLLFKFKFYIFINFSLNAINCPCCYSLVVWGKNIYVESKVKLSHLYVRIRYQYYTSTDTRIR